jgi:hypothetical protein
MTSLALSGVSLFSSILNTITEILTIVEDVQSTDLACDDLQVTLETSQPILTSMAEVLESEESLGKTLKAIDGIVTQMKIVITQYKQTGLSRYVTRKIYKKELIRLRQRMETHNAMLTNGMLLILLKRNTNNINGNPQLVMQNIDYSVSKGSAPVNIQEQNERLYRIDKRLKEAADEDRYILNLDIQNFLMQEDVDPGQRDDLKEAANVVKN